MHRQLAEVEEAGQVSWGQTLGLEAQRKLVEREMERSCQEAKRLRSLLFRADRGGDTCMRSTAPLSTVGLALRLADPSCDTQARGPIVKAVFNGTHPDFSVAQVVQPVRRDIPEDFRVLDEILEVDGRDVRAMSAHDVMDLLVDAPGTRSAVKVARPRMLA